MLLQLLSLVCWYILSHCHGWLVMGTALQQLHQEHSRSWCCQVHLWRAVWVYISSRSLDGGFLLQVDCCRTAGAVPVWLGRAPVDSICVCHGEHTTGGALHGVCSLAAGAAGVGVLGATAVGSPTSWVAGADVDAAGATLPMLDVPDLTVSTWHSQMWSWACLYCPPPMTWSRLCGWWWQWATGYWQLGQQRMEVSCSSLTGHGTLHFGWYIG